MDPSLALLAALLLGLVVGLVVGALAAWSALRARLGAAELAAARLRGDDLAEDRRADAVTSLVAPLREQLQRVEGQLAGLDRERVRAAAELREQVAAVQAGSQRLGDETAALVDALRRPQARGRWGELQLRRTVELAGMLDRCDFEEQPSLRTPDGVLRPDLLVRLPGGGCVAVDAKVSLAAYLEAVEARGDDERAARVAAHARHLRAHVDRLADKAYWRALPASPEFVVLFLPGEAMLAPALEADPALLEHAAARHVHLATPTTLLSLLRAVAHGWRTRALSDSAREVLEAGTQLHGRLAVLGGHVDKLGRSLSRSVLDFNATVGSLERSVVPAARRLADLADRPDAMPVPAPVVEVPRPAPHLAVVLPGEIDPEDPALPGRVGGAG